MPGKPFFEHVVRSPVTGQPVMIATKPGDDSGVYVSVGAGPALRVPADALDAVVRSMRRANGHLKANEATARRCS